MVSREEIRLAYVMLLGREPEDEAAYAVQQIHSDLWSLRTAMIGSEEGIWRLRHDIRTQEDNAIFHYFRPVAIFIHVEKTAGTSLNHALLQHFGSHRSSPSHLNWLPNCSVAELNSYDFVTGHFTYQEARSIPRHPKRIITVLREPTARLISFYRFHRAHPNDLASNPMVRAAKELSPEQFFDSEEVRASPQVDNAYLRLFSELPALRSHWEPYRIEEAAQTVMRRISEIDCVGITENMPGTVRLLAKALSITDPESPIALNVTQDLHHTKAGYLQVADVELTPQLRRVMKPLIEHDERIYSRAKALFTERLAKLNTLQLADAEIYRRKTLLTRWRELRARS